MIAKTVVLSLIASGSVCAAAEGTVGRTVAVSPKFLKALAHVEWGGPGAAPDGDGGRAVGPFQIWAIYMAEANRIARCPAFSLKDRSSYAASAEMATLVLTHWSRWHARKGRTIGYAELCSLHLHPNGRWRPENMLTDLEKGRTARLRQYMDER